MKLIVSPHSPFVRKVRVLIREAGREGEVEEVAVKTSALATDPAILPHNPSGRIPVLVRDDGPAIPDSRLICRYLDARWGAGVYPAARLWDVLALEALAEGATEAALAMSYERRMRPEERQFPDWIEAQWAKVARTLDHIEDRWAASLVEKRGAPPDGAQIALACALGYIDFRHGERGWRTGRPRLAAFDARMAERPSMRATAPA